MSLLVALFTVAGALLFVGGWAQYHFAGQERVSAAMCIANFHLEMAASERARFNAYTRYVKAKAESLVMENRLALLEKETPIKERCSDAEACPETSHDPTKAHCPKEHKDKRCLWRLADVREEIAVQRDRMTTAKREQEDWDGRMGRLKSDFDSGMKCPEQGGILWPKSS